MGIDEAKVAMGLPTVCYQWQFEPDRSLKIMARRMELLGRYFFWYLVLYLSKAHCSHFGRYGRSVSDCGLVTSSELGKRPGNVLGGKRERGCGYCAHAGSGYLCVRACVGLRVHVLML